MGKRIAGEIKDRYYHQTPRSYIFNINLPKEDFHWSVHEMGLLHTKEI